MLTDLAIALYFIEVLANIEAILVSILATLITILFIGLVPSLIMYREGDKISWLKPTIKYSSIYTIFALVFIALIPSERTMYIMAGLIAGDKVIQVISESDTAKKSLELLNHKLDDMLEEYSTEGEK